MASAHLVCHDCRLTLHVGSLRYADDDTRHGFTHGKYLPDELAGLIEAFIAIHLEHDVQTYAEQDFDSRDWLSYNAIRPMPTVPDVIARVTTTSIRPYLVRIEAHDGPTSG